MNPLSQLTEIANSGVRNIVSAAFRGYEKRVSERSQKCDPVFERHSMDVLRRAAYENELSVLFINGDENFPYVTPDTTIRDVIAKLKDNVFPTGSSFSIVDDSANALLQDILKEIKFNLKAEKIVEESALMGYCALRSIYSESLQKWTLEIKPKEYLVAETVEGMSDEYIAIGSEWPVDRNGKRYWKKERWTETEYQVWPELPEKIPGRKPEFDPKDAISEPNNYQEIPYTIIPHYFDSIEMGEGVVDESEINNAKSLIRLRHKRHYGHLKYMDPNPVIKNRTNSGTPIDLGIGKVIDVTTADPQTPVEMNLLEFAGMPDSVKEEIRDIQTALYKSAGLKPPPPDDQLNHAGGTSTAGVALRMIDKDDAKTIETLRDNGYTNVLRHFEKILRMGKALSITEYSIINPENPDTYLITASYPDFFPPTDQDIGLKLANMNAAALPVSIRARKIAELFGIEDEKEIQEIEAELSDKKALEQAALTNSGF